MKNNQVPVLGFAAFSGTGKTTLLTQLIPVFKHLGIRTGLIKHSHHNFEIDKPGKDSFRLRMAGASPVLLVSSHRRAMITEFSTPQEPSLEDQIPFLTQHDIDLILVEGFKKTAFPKIELHRPVLQKALIYPEDDSIIAVASDQTMTLPSGITLLDINDPHMIAEFICQRFNLLQS